MIARPKPVEFRGSALADLRAFPVSARREAGYQLDQVQNGREPGDWKPMKTVGQGVQEIRIRDTSGTFRVLYVAKLVPEEVSDVEAAAVQTAFATAWHMLFTRGGLRPGETVLVNSVGSGIGSAAVQLAHMAGAYVIGNSSGDAKLARAAELGMDAGVNYKKQDLVAEVMRLTEDRGVDLV